MLQEAIEKVRALAVEAAGFEAETKLIENKFNPRKYLAQWGNVAPVEKDVPPPLRKQKAHSLDALIDLAMDAPAGAQIWHGPELVRLLFDPADRLEWAEYKLEVTAPFLALKSYATKELSQQDLVRLIRGPLATVLVEQPVLLAAVRQIKFSSSTSGQSTIDHGGESLGREVVRNLVGAQAIPEEIKFHGQVYREVEQPFDLVAALSIDVEEEEFSYDFVGDGLRDAIDEAQAVLGNLLREKLPKTKVYYGTP